MQRSGAAVQRLSCGSQDALECVRAAVTSVHGVLGWPAGPWNPCRCWSEPHCFVSAKAPFQMPKHPWSRCRARRWMRASTSSERSLPCGSLTGHGSEPTKKPLSRVLYKATTWCALHGMYYMVCSMCICTLVPWHVVGAMPGQTQLAPAEPTSGHAPCLACLAERLGH